MPFSPKFNYRNQLVSNLGTIEAARAVIDVLPLPLDTVLRLRHEAFERSTRSSTAIEGNTLDTTALRHAIAAGERTGQRAEEEVRNYWRALDRLEEFADDHGSISEAFIQEIHKIVMTSGPGRTGGKSPYRILECPVVDQASGRVDYAPPVPKDVPTLMAELVAWLASDGASDLPAPLRAGVLSHRFITIHPFNDGNGRTGRLLATAELWRSGYKMRGFFSFEEHFNANRALYYDSLQMGLPVNYYEGRNNCDQTAWLEYFIATLSGAAQNLHSKALQLQTQKGLPSAPWDRLSRRQQQVLTRLLTRKLDEPRNSLSIRPADVQAWFGVSDTTAHEWLSNWVKETFVVPVQSGKGERVRRYELPANWQTVIEQATLSERNKPSD